MPPTPLGCRRDLFPRPPVPKPKTSHNILNWNGVRSCPGLLRVSACLSLCFCRWCGPPPVGWDALFTPAAASTCGAAPGSRLCTWSATTPLSKSCPGVASIQYYKGFGYLRESKLLVAWLVGTGTGSCTT